MVVMGKTKDFAIHSNFYLVVFPPYQVSTNLGFSPAQLETFKIRAGSCAIYFQTESVLALNKKTESELVILVFLSSAKTLSV